MYEERFMERAIALSARALSEPGTEPFGAVVVRDGEIVGEGLNHARAHFDPTSHGEVEAIRDACARLHCLDLSGCDLYTSCEPCALCVSAMGIVGISKMYYAASMDQAGAAFAGLTKAQRHPVDPDALRTEAGAPVERRSMPAERHLDAQAAAILAAWGERRKAGLTAALGTARACEAGRPVGRSGPRGSARMIDQDADARSETVTFDFRALPARDRYKLMIGTIVPRPIALVTTIDPLGRINAAPFSFFNCLSHDPPILALGVENHPDMSFKDTAGNIRLTEVFTVNIVSRAIAEAMHVCAVGFPLGTDELVEAGLTAIAGTVVAAPRIAEAPAAFECRRHTTLEIGKARQIILGEIVYAHYHAGVVDAERLRIDPARLDAIARLGGSTCATIRDRFDMPTPTLEGWMAAKAGVGSA